MAAASIRACFVTLRPQHGSELPSELRFAPELQLQFLGAEARNGSLAQGDALSLRRERSGVYCTAATLELSFQEAGASAELPFRLLLDKASFAEGELVWQGAAEPPRLALRTAAGAPSPDEGAVDLELVLLVSADGPPTAVAASLALVAPPPPPLLLPGALLRTASGRGPALEPIDEDVGVRGPATRFRRAGRRGVPLFPLLP